MGLLDEAIREHLDLKRRRGADPAEVERAEREALGPVRRNREPSAADVDEPVSGGIAYDQAADEEDWAYDEGSEQGDEVPGPGDESGVPPLELSGHDDPSRSSRAASGPSFDETAFGESAFEEPMFEDEQDEPPATGTGVGAETAEYDVEEAMSGERPHEDEGSEEGDDMLDQTPEFLQDTPDHDRLWFEQRPPRDFDFDG